MNQAVMLANVSSQISNKMNLTNPNSLASLLVDDPKFGNMLSEMMLNTLADEEMLELEGLELEGLELEEMINEFFHLIEEALVEPMTTETDSEQEELVAYLTQLIDLFNEIEDQALTHPDLLTENYEELYSLFQQMPISTVESEKFSKMFGTLHLPDKENGGLQAVAKWNLLLQAIRQQKLEGNKLSSTTSSLDSSTTNTLASSKTSSLDSSIPNSLAFPTTNTLASSTPSFEKGTNQTQQLIVSILSKWQQDPEWLSFLKQKLQSESASKNILAEVFKTSPEQVPRFSIQLPISLLLQANSGEQAEGKAIGSNESNATLVSNKADISSQLALEPRTIPIEAKGTERVAEPKQTEAPVPSARFAHLLDDVKGILRNQFQNLRQGETSQIRIKIFPEHLGHLDIRITSIGGKVSAHLMASHQMAKESLEFGLGQLRVALTQQGIQVDRIEVTQQNNTQSNTQGTLQDQKSGQQFFQNKEQSSSSTSKPSNSQFEEEEAINSEVDEYGNSVSKINYVV